MVQGVREDFLLPGAQDLTCKDAQTLTKQQHVVHH